MKRARVDASANTRHDIVDVALEPRYYAHVDAVDSHAELFTMSLRLLPYAATPL